MADRFAELKYQLDITDVARHYGVEVDRHGKALCFVHNEQRPSLSFKGNRWKCFSCSAGGDVIDMVSIVQGVQPLEAAKELDSLYGLSLFDNPLPLEKIRAQSQKREDERAMLAAFEEWEYRACNAWIAYIKALKRVVKRYALQAPDSAAHPLYGYACLELASADKIFHEVFINGNFTARLEFWRTRSEEIEIIEQYFNYSRQGGNAC